MEVQCENRKCGKTVDLRDEAVFCRHCGRYYCTDCYDASHEGHDVGEDVDEPKWAMALQR